MKNNELQIWPSFSKKSFFLNLLLDNAGCNCIQLSSENVVMEWIYFRRGSMEYN
jgi:hypothetical protein